MENRPPSRRVMNSHRRTHFWRLYTLRLYENGQELLALGLESVFGTESKGLSVCSYTNTSCETTKPREVETPRGVFDECVQLP